MSWGNHVVRCITIVHSPHDPQQVDDLREQTEAATRIQALQRQKASSRRVLELKQSNRAATKIQAVYRGKKTRD